MTTIAHKLGVRQGLLGAVVPHEHISDFPDVELGLPATQWIEADVMLWPAAAEADVRTIFDQYGDDVAKVRVVWICYKKNNVVPINRDTIWNIALEYGWKAVAQVSLDDSWSAVRIRQHKAGEM